MKLSKKTLVCVVGLVFLGISQYVVALSFDDLEYWAVIGNIGNSADTRAMHDGTSDYGSVGYEYSIGKYEVTNAQYAAFLNAVATSSDPYGLYNENMGTSIHAGIIRTMISGSYLYNVKDGYALKPVMYVSFYDALRFINWLNSGTTEDGAYTFNSQTNEYLGATHNVGATYWLPTEDEWYKAAYYDPTLDLGIGGYWDFPTRSNTISTADANYDSYVGTVTDVGTYDNESYYGTYDQAGNVWEWNETFIGGNRFFRGGRWVDPSDSLSAFVRIGNGPTSEFSHIGFRVASLYSGDEQDIIPEPLSMGLLLLSIGGLVLRRTKRV